MLACIQDGKNQTRGNLSFRKWNEKELYAKTDF